MDARGLVDHLVVDGRHLADVQLDLVLLRHEFPRQAGRDVGIEADGQLAGNFMLRRDTGDLGGAGKAGDAAENLVERDCGERRAHHPGDQDAASGGNRHVAAQTRFAGIGFAVVRHSGRTSTIGPFTRVTT